jgi:hypothetical protein
MPPALPITEDDAHIFTQDGPDENANPDEPAVAVTHFGNWTTLRDYISNGTDFQYTYVTSRTTNPAFVHAGTAAVKMEWVHSHNGTVKLEIHEPWNDTPPFGGYSPVPPEGTTVQVSAWIYTPASNNVPSVCSLRIVDNFDPGGGPGVTIGAANIDLVPDAFTQVVATGVIEITDATIATSDTAVTWALTIGSQTAHLWNAVTNPAGGLVAGDSWYVSDADAFALLGGWGVGMVRMNQ